MEEKIKNLDIQINKSKMKSDQEVKEMNEFKAKLGTSETKLSKSSNINTKVCKDLKEDLENAEECWERDCSQGSGGCIRTFLVNLLGFYLRND